MLPLHTVDRKWGREGRPVWAVRQWLCCWSYHSLQSRSPFSLRHSCGGWLFLGLTTVAIMTTAFFIVSEYKPWQVEVSRISCCMNVCCLSAARTARLLKYDDGSFFSAKPWHRRETYLYANSGEATSGFQNDAVVCNGGTCFTKVWNLFLSLWWENWVYSFSYIHS
jgi:hypothetical protein